MAKRQQYRRLFRLNGFIFRARIFHAFPLDGETERSCAVFLYFFFFFFHFGFCSVPRNISSSRGLSSYSRPANLGIYLDTPCRRKRGGTRLNSFYWFRFQREIQTRAKVCSTVDTISLSGYNAKWPTGEYNCKLFCIISYSIFFFFVQ